MSQTVVTTMASVRPSAVFDRHTHLPHTNSLTEANQNTLWGVHHGADGLCTLPEADSEESWPSVKFPGEKRDSHTVQPCKAVRPQPNPSSSSQTITCLHKLLSAFEELRSCASHARGKVSTTLPTGTRTSACTCCLQPPSPATFRRTLS